MTTPSPLVSRLLEAIGEREKAAREAQPGPWHVGNAVDPTQPCNIHTIPAAGGVADNLAWFDAEHIIWHDPTSVLRLCQAHREIVDMYQQAEALRGHWTIRDLDHASAMGRLTTLGLVLQALSRAYRIQEET